MIDKHYEMNKLIYLELWSLKYPRSRSRSRSRSRINSFRSLKMKITTTKKTFKLFKVFEVKKFGNKKTFGKIKTFSFR